VFTEQEMYMLLDSPMFQSPTVMYENVLKTHPNIKGDVEKQGKLDELMKGTIKTESRNNAGTFQIRSIFTDKSGKEVGVSSWSSIGAYDSSNNLKIQLDKMANDFNTQVNKIVQ
jgi:hypothetical protein